MVRSGKSLLSYSKTGLSIDTDANEIPIMYCQLLGNLMQQEQEQNQPTQAED